MLFKTVPFPHQLREFEASKNKPAWALLWEMGCGKTKPTIDTVAHLAELGEITGLLILAPNGVHRNWVVDQLPIHTPDALAETMRVHLWMSSKAGNKSHAKAAGETLEHKGFAAVAMSYDAIMTDVGAKYARSFLQKRRCMYVLDESPRIKTPGAKRTIRVLTSARYAPYRRILTGTLVDDKPFDVYTQLKFTNPDIWKAIGCDDNSAFKATFGIFKNQRISTGRQNQDGSPKMAEFPMLVGYRNLDLLKRIVTENGSRLRKEDVLPDLPPKLYSKRYFEMTAEQWRVYEDLRREFYTFLESGLVSADLAITRMLRFQQIASGYLPTDNGEDGELVKLCTPNPRIKLLVEIVEEAGHQVIVWAKYRADITSILEALKEAGISATRYDGQCSETEMGNAVDAFKRGDVQVFVSNPAKGGEGLTLTCAKTMVYFNNSFKLSQRLQSEDRFHRIGQDRPVHVIDLAAVDTIDNAIIDSLRKKYELASFVQGDELRSWI